MGCRGKAWTPGSRPWRQALSFAPEHLSCYQLTIMAGETPALRTPLARRVARGEISLPDEETQREFFLLTANFLTARGYLHYEVANFAREETNMSAATTSSTGPGPPTWGWVRRRIRSWPGGAGGIFRQWGNIARL